MKVVLSGVPAKNSGAGTGIYGLFRDLAAPFGVAVFVPMFTNSVANLINAGTAEITAAIDSVKLLSVVELVCIAVGIFTVLFLPQIYKDKKGAKI